MEENNFFPSAVPETPIDPQLMKPALSPNSQSGSYNQSEMAVIVTIGPSKKPVPLMRYEFYDQARQAAKYEEVNQQLILKSKSIQSKFSNLILDICSLLQGSSIEKLQMWLSYQSCSKPVQSLKAFDSDSAALKAKTIPTLIMSLQCYTSWYNYELIADIAKKFCGNEGSVLVEVYEAELKSYFRTLILHCPPLFPDHENSTKPLDSFKVNTEWKPSSAVLEDIAVFKSTLCQLCKLDSRFLVIKMLNGTDFSMSWACPRAASEMIREQNLKRGIGLDGDSKISNFEWLGTERTSTPSTAFEGQLHDSQLSHLDGHYSNKGTIIRNGANRTSEQNKDCSVEDSIVSHEVKRNDHENTKTNTASSISATLPDYVDGSSQQSKILSCESDATPSMTTTQREEQKDSALENMDSKISEASSLTTPAKKPVGFLWRILGRARPTSHANIHVVSIQATSKVSDDDIEVRKGQHLKALYRVSEKVFIETPSLMRGFIPYSSCRLSRKHYGSHSTILQLSYVRLYPESPDGIDILPTESVPSITMVAAKNYLPEATHEELRVQSGQVFTALYCDSSLVYAVCEENVGLLPRSVCVLSKQSQKIFQQWQVNEKPFQSDYIMKHNEARPAILNENPISQKTPSKVGKVFTIVQNFAPASSMSGNFTIRKGLRVKVVKESDQEVLVTTKSGVSFWIPQNHVRPARKSSIYT